MLQMTIRSRSGRRLPWTATLSMLLIAVVTGGCITVSSSGGGFSMGSSVHVEEGEVARDEIVLFGGSVRVDGEARRDVVVIGGSITVNGTVGGDVVAVGGSLRLGPDARVRGDAVVVGGSLNRSPGAEIEGELVNVGVAGFDGFPGFSFGLGDWLGFSAWRLAWRTTQLIYWLLLALLTVALVGDRVSSAARAVQREPIRLFLIGLVGFFALGFLFIVFLVLSFVLLGIPFLMALLLGWWLAYIFGMVTMFQVLGDGITGALGKRDATQLGLVTVGALALGVLHFFPVIGWVTWTVAAFLGLGAVFATRFGTNQPWMGDHPLRGGPPPRPAPGAGLETDPWRESPVEPPVPDPDPRQG